MGNQTKCEHWLIFELTQITLKLDYSDILLEVLLKRLSMKSSENVVYWRKRTFDNCCNQKCNKMHIRKIEHVIWTFKNLKEHKVVKTSTHNFDELSERKKTCYVFFIFLKNNNVKSYIWNPWGVKYVVHTTWDKHITLKTNINLKITLLISNLSEKSKRFQHIRHCTKD